MAISIGAGIAEEIAYRYFGINTIFLLTGSLEISLLITTIFFSLSHIITKDSKGWFGPVNINYALIAGFGYGLLAIKFGIIVAIVMHTIHDIISFLTSREKPA